jgi:hypothetical protein
MCWKPQFGCGVFFSRGFNTSSCFLLGLQSCMLRCCCRLWLRLLRPGRPPGGGHFRQLGRIHDRLGRAFLVLGWIGRSLEDTPPRTT